MAYPDYLSIRSYGGAVPPTYITSDLQNYYVNNQVITVASLNGWYEVSETGKPRQLHLARRGLLLSQSIQGL